MTWDLTLTCRACGQELACLAELRDGLTEFVGVMTAGHVCPPKPASLPWEEPELPLEGL